MRSMIGIVVSAAAAAGSALASAVCCAAPILYVTAGVGAGLAGTFEPLRPWFLAGAVLFLGLGFYGVYGRPVEACLEEGVCDALAEARRRRRKRAAVLWVSAGLVALFATFPIWIGWLG